MLRPARRAESGYRLYAPAQLEQLRFIQQSKQLGLRLRQVRRILELSESGAPPCEQVAPLLRRMIVWLNERIDLLRRRRDALLYALRLQEPEKDSACPCCLLHAAMEYLSRRDEAMPRTIEVFTAGCPLCDETIQRVKSAVASCGCTVITRTPDSPEAQQYDIRAVPAIVVDGQLVFTGVPTQEQANALLTR